MSKKLYLIASLRNSETLYTGNRLREEYDVFDDWYTASDDADDWWQAYEKARGRNLREALNGRAAQHTFSFDNHHLVTSDLAVLLLPAGRSGHLEAGYMIGLGKPTFLLMEQEYERWDVMYNFFTGIAQDVDELLKMMRGLP